MVDLLSRVVEIREKKRLPFIILMEGGRDCLWLRQVDVINSGRAVLPGLTSGHMLLIYPARLLT